uniref:Uncharacterized protein n=1 Tax=Nelumbo nucifera TaxID=4432 RepID=A0A822XIW3_NELNU|nr:TPA_asm: hypothetical protein HUJ06_021106 [Nelumbo nucifera]
MAKLKRLRTLAEMWMVELKAQKEIGKANAIIAMA